MTTMNLDQLHTENGHKPNFTVMLPGACNAKCGFCFWNHKDGQIKPPTDYMEKLADVVSKLSPETFPAVSLTGGEPTLSKYLKPVFGLLRSSRYWDRIVR
jgi:organic radical activating enzyme